MKNAITAIKNKYTAFSLYIPALLWQFLFFYIPAAGIVLLSFIGFDAQGWYFTTEFYSSLFASIYFRVIARSLLLALATSFTCLLAAYPMCYFLAVKARKAKNILLFFLILPFWTSLMVQVYSWFFILEKQGLLNSILLKLGFISAPIPFLNSLFAIYLVMVYCYLPFMIFPLYANLEKLDRRLLEASSDLGANAWNTFKHVTLPLSLPGIRTGFFLVFVPAFGELVIPVLLGGGRYLFVGPLISQFFLSARDIGRGSAFTILSGVVLALSAWAIMRVFKWFINPRVQRK
ncbi:MAG: ABC transporter permease [Candidatus Dependentiae bacterium]